MVVDIFCCYISVAIVASGRCYSHRWLSLVVVGSDFCYRYFECQANIIEYLKLHIFQYQQIVYR